MGKVSYSFDNEYYYDIFDTEEEAKAEAMKELRRIERRTPEELPEEIYIGTCEFFKPSLLSTGWDIMEDIQQQAYNEGFGEYANDYPDATKEQWRELETGIEKVFQRWIKKYNLNPSFFKVNTYDVYEYDAEKIKLRKTGKGIQK